MELKRIDKTSVDRLCAGQSISGLSSAVKELIENSLDAGATHIEITIKDYGLDCVEVKDNGSGIAPDHYHLVASRYTTSKIKEFEDLLRITSFGFRGEALNSLCYLADTKIITRTANDTTAMNLQFDESGQVASMRPCAGTIGTTVSFSNIFRKLPVRRKDFEKNHKKEYAKLVSMITSYAMICDTVSFSASHWDKKGLRTKLCYTTGTGGLQHSLTLLFGLKFFQSLLYFTCEIPDGIISGYVSELSEKACLNNNSRQYFFINRRPVDIPKVAKALTEVYRQLNAVIGRHGHFPALILNLTISPNHLDINLSPDKRTIILEKELLVIDAIQTNLVKILSPEDRVFELHELPSLAKSQISLLSQYESGKTSSSTFKPEIADSQISSIKKFENSSISKDDSSVEEEEEHEELDEELKETRGAHTLEDFEKEDQQELLEEDSKDSKMDDFIAEDDDEEDEQLSSESNKNTSENSEIFQITPSQIIKREEEDVQIDISIAQILKNRQDESFGPSTKKMKYVETVDDDGIHLLSQSTSEKSEPFTSSQFLSGSTKSNNSSRTDEFKETSLISSIPSFTSASPFTPIIKKNTPLSTTVSSFSHEDNEEDEEDDEDNCSQIKEMPKLGLKSSLKQFALGTKSVQVPTTVNNTSIDTLPKSPEEFMTPTSHKCDHHVKQDSDISTTSSSLPVTMIIDYSEAKKLNSSGTKPIIPFNFTAFKMKFLEKVDMEILLRSKKSNQSSYIGNSPFNSIYQIDADLSEKKSKGGKKSTKRTSSTSYQSQSTWTRLEDATSTQAEQELSRSITRQDFREMRVIGQFNRSYIIACKGKQLFILDQHACDEKYLYEHICKRNSNNMRTQFLLAPLSIPELTLEDDAIVRDNLKLFERCGFQWKIDEDSGRVKLLTQVTVGTKILGINDILELIEIIRDGRKNLLMNQLQRLKEESKIDDESTELNTKSFNSDDDSDIRHNLQTQQSLSLEIRKSQPKKLDLLLPSVLSACASEACRSAVMFGDPLNIEKLKRIVSQMSDLYHPWNCPHGRPTMRHLFTLSELLKNSE